MSGGKLNVALTVPPAAPPPTPASRTNEMLDSTQDAPSPGPQVPGAFPEGETDADTSMGEALVASVNAVKAGLEYFGVVGNEVETSQGQEPNLGTTSTSSASSLPLQTSIYTNPTRLAKQGVFAESTPALASCEATENALLSPIPSTPHPTPMLGSTYRKEHANSSLHAVASERGSLHVPLAGDSPFTPIPPVDPAVSYFPVSLPAQHHTNTDEDANALPSPQANAATVATAEHVFTAHGVHVPATLGAAQVAHAGAFIEEGNHHKTENAVGCNNNEDEDEDGREGISKREGKASRFVAKLKEKMHVG
ncbi:hypothetical protein B0H12DRAFT_1321607 [Mycena haematopus]|nr:hypothetical protein B0H12DRAFT_1321607 [Mycena haematopus]